MTLHDATCKYKQLPVYTGILENVKMWAQFNTSQWFDSEFDETYTYRHSYN